MNFFRQFLSLACLSKKKPRRVHRNHSDLQVRLGKTESVIDLKKMEPFIQDDFKIPVYEVQHDLEEISTKIKRDLEDFVAKRQHSLAGKAEKIRPMLDGKDEQIQRDLDKLATCTRRDLDELATWTRRDLEETAAKIKRDLDEMVAWIRHDLNETAARIRLDLEKLESHIQHDLEVPVDKIQHDLEETSIQVQWDLQDLVASSLVEKTEQIKPKLEKENKQVQLRTATWIQTEVETTVAHILYDLNVPVDQSEPELDEILIQIERDQEFKMAEQNKCNLDEEAAEYQLEWKEKAALIQSELGMELTRPHFELLENIRFHNGMSLENFVLHKVLGKGSFGKVMLAELKGSGEYFAIKALKKDNILANSHIQFLMTEKRVLKLTADCPFLAHLYFTFQTKANLFFVMEYINGGDLFFHILEKGQFDLVSTQFYAAEMTCGLQFLHRNGIIYRDLKLENVMLDRDGHIKIVDFGLCKDNMFGDERTKSFCGTDNYIAPEIFQEQQYFSPADWWSFGVLLFEMLTGESPFQGADKVELHVSVCVDSPPYPSWINQESKDILEKLLEKDPNRRLGTFGNIREHPFFESIDWPRLERREVEPPFKPKLVNRNDCRYFDEVFLNQTPKMSQGDCSYFGPMDQSAFADFSFINPMFCRTY